MVRVVKSLQGVVVDPTSKLAGRGAYLHNQRACWEQALKGALAHALRSELTTEDYERLSEFAKMLPE
jgi:predicted RNA-binding protein YlxR (DUF448 family)